MNSNFLDTWESFLEAKAYLEAYNSDILVLDVETDGVQEKTAKLFGIGLCLSDHEGFYIPLRHNDDIKTSWWNKEQELEVINWIVSFCRKKKLVGWNIIFDVLTIYHNWGVDLTECVYSDGILQKHLLDEDQPFGLKPVGVKYLGEWADKAQQELYESIKKNGGSTTKDNLEMWRADSEILSTYCCWDVLITRKLFDIFEPRIHAEGLADLFYKDEIMPLYKEVTIPMKKHGFTVDVPYFTQLNDDISNNIVEIEQNIQRALKEHTEIFVKSTLDKHYPINPKGKFPKVCAQLLGFTLPGKDGKITLAKKEIEAILEPQLETHRNFLYWLKGTEELNPEVATKTQRYWHQIDNVDSPYIFNLNSNDHLKWLFFEHFKEKPLSKTDTGEPQVDENFLDSIASKYTWMPTFIDYKKLNKLKSTYIEGVLERHVNGVLYAGFLMHGTTSGRFSCTSPNLQNLPRVKEEESGISELVLRYSNNIKKGFIAGKGYKLVNSDFAQLEPRAFAEACGDKKLIKSFVDGEDLYGSIACNIWNLDCKPNEVKKKYNEKRQAAKVVALAVVYGAEAGRISKLMGIEYSSAQEIIDDYLNAYPGLKKYMSQCNEQVCINGYIKTKFGRVRHLPEVKRLYQQFGLKLLNKKWAKQQGHEEISWKFKSMLNLSKNFPIQGIAAHIVNRCMIAINREFKNKGLEATIIAMIHDEICCVVKAGQEEQAKDIVRYCMENTVKLEVPLKAEPMIADNWKDCK